MYLSCKAKLQHFLAVIHAPCSVTKQDAAIAESHTVGLLMLLYVSQFLHETTDNTCYSVWYSTCNSLVI